LLAFKLRIGNVTFGSVAPRWERAFRKLYFVDGIVEAELPAWGSVASRAQAPAWERAFRKLRFVDGIVEAELPAMRSQAELGNEF
jgi:hypothetical protein